MTSLGVVPFAFLCGLLLIAQPQFPIFDLQSPSALNRLHTGAPVPDLRSSISHLRSQAFRIPLAPCRFAAHAFLCVLCVSVVQFGTVTVIEGNSPQRRRVHREDLDPQKTTTPDSAQPCFPLCSLCLCGSIRGDGCHRGASPQRRRVHREDLNPQKVAKTRKGPGFDSAVLYVPSRSSCRQAGVAPPLHELALVENSRPPIPVALIQATRQSLVRTSDNQLHPPA